MGSTMTLGLFLFLSCSGATKIVEDIDADGFPRQEDCDDLNADVNPSAQEICNGIDDNCDSLIDDEDPETTGLGEGFLDNDGDGFGVEPYISSCSVVAPVSGDCDDSNPSINPYANEYCNGEDDDCDGTADEDALDSMQFYRDNDGDGYGSAISTNWDCSAPDGFSTEGGDCNDEDPLISPSGKVFVFGLLLSDLSK